MSKEIYIGNGRTINVEENKEFVNYLDIEKLKKIVEENKGKEISFGATSDWYFTAQTVREDTFDPFNQSILRRSSWDTFSVEIDRDNKEDLTIKVPIKESNTVYNAGFLRGIYKIEFWFDGLYSKIIKDLDYENLKEFQEEMKPILQKYASRVKPVELEKDFADFTPEQDEILEDTTSMEEKLEKIIN